MQGEQEQEQVEIIEDVQQEQETINPILEERLAKLEKLTKDQESYLTKLQQDNATYKQIITERGQRQDDTPVKVVNDSQLKTDVARLKEQFRNGEITSEELSLKSLELIELAERTSRERAIEDVKGLYQEEQKIQKAFGRIFEDDALKGLQEEMNDIAYGYYYAGIQKGMGVDQASEYARENTKKKIDLLKKKFSSASDKDKAKIIEEAEKGSAFKSEIETTKKEKKKEEPVTAQQSQRSFVEMRRAKMMQ